MCAPALWPCQEHLVAVAAVVLDVVVDPAQRLLDVDDHVLHVALRVVAVVHAHHHAVVAPHEQTEQCTPRLVADDPRAAGDVDEHGVEPWVEPAAACEFCTGERMEPRVLLTAGRCRGSCG